MNLVYEWTEREVRDFNALCHPDPHARLLRNHWPLKCVPYFVLRWTTSEGVAKSAAHFCSGHAHWRAQVFREAGCVTEIEIRYIPQGERVAVVDSRTRVECDCENCRLRQNDLLPLPNPPKMSAARARRLARGG
ncbi:hypothetical protein [Noviherbaspirillum pedocola]|uniref:Uncharacterized protein n=1 Tax=Noviherbaspirillum pedocola TaxID=2801341 RepID=A0A934SSW6_9BURK|nr:hypothetical protein [Noviherbaspirillum pedocola]MBK4736171.1 hypothetical protein [Noviherbaspirillum pedocola]